MVQMSLSQNLLIILYWSFFFVDFPVLLALRSRYFVARVSSCFIRYFNDPHAILWRHERNTYIQFDSLSRILSKLCE